MRHLIHRPLRAASIVLLSVLLSAAPAAAQIFVDASATGANDGTTWANAFTDLQSALSLAVSGDEVWVASGTYKPTTGTDREATFQLKSGVGLYGGFAGTETLRAERNCETNVTTLSGDIGVPCDSGYSCDDNSCHVVTSVGVDSTTVLDGFVVTRGAGNDGEFWPYFGAGMIVVDGSPRISNVIFSQNGIYRGIFSNGGGMAAIFANPVLTKVTFSDNTGTDGGGLWGDATLIDVEFLGNDAEFLGGGMFGSGDLTNVTFHRNRAGDGGGGMSGDGNTLHLTNVTFSENSVWGCFGGHGGGLWGGGTLLNVTFTNNRAECGGGGGMYGEGHLTNVTFIENESYYGGGGMFGGGTLTNVIFTRNRSLGEDPGWNIDGGGMWTSGNPVLTNVTFSENRAPHANGGALRSSGNPILTNVIFWHNEAGIAGHEIFNESGTPTISYSLIEGSGGSGAGWDTSLGTDGGNNIDADPLFLDSAGGNLRLALGSPAINAGNNAAIPTGVTTDLDGNPRIHCLAVDMGAYESQFPDETPPAMAVTLSRDVLWPPNHKMSTITATVTLMDDCDPVPTFELISITSSDPDNGTGDGDTVNDIQGADIGTADVEFELRSERSGQGSGRIYTITYASTDESRNTDTVEVFVRVPHDQSGQALASAGFLPDGTGLVPGVETFVLVVPSMGGQVPELSKLRGSRTNARAFVGNHLAQIPALSSQVLDVTADRVGDLVLEYPAKATLGLVALSALESEPVAFRYEDGSGVGYLVPDIFALGQPIALPGRQGPHDELADQRIVAPLRTALVSIRPNPFNPSTTVSFDLAMAGMARVEVYDPRGTLVRTLRDQSLPAGRYEVTWDGRNQQGRAVSTGVYFVRLVTSDMTQVRKAILMK